MHCPFCGHEETKVADSRLAGEGRQVRRRRECLACGERFEQGADHRTAAPAALHIGKQVYVQVGGEPRGQSRGTPGRGVEVLDELAVVRIAGHPVEGMPRAQPGPPVGLETRVERVAVALQEAARALTNPFIADAGERR